MDCLKEAGLKMSEEGLSALAMAADANGNNKVEYEEFMTHFKSMIKILKTQFVLNAINTNSPKYEPSPK